MVHVWSIHGGIRITSSPGSHCKACVPVVAYNRDSHANRVSDIILQNTGSRTGSTTMVVLNIPMKERVPDVNCCNQNDSFVRTGWDFAQLLQSKHACIADANFCVVYNKQDIPIKQMQRASKAEGKLFPIRERVSKTPRSEKTADAAKSKPWRDGNNRFTVPTGGIIKSSYIEFQIRRTRKSPALRFNIGETVILRRGAMEFRATVYSFTPRSLSGSDICASGTLRIHHQSEIAWELRHNSM